MSATPTAIVENGTFEVSEEWKNELYKRSREIDEGKVELINGNEFLERLKSV